ncbi:DegV family protein [Lacticaseibacillus hulanensis]|uniref:DegV family protein n=1 Tax=Lacticaseibacillus hulanensis TaxID=2493111 RepID=UPI000FD6CAA6|nr:DegV family protein [Lacticaseibacillus hulanensis]
MKTAIVTDSSAYLSPEEAKALDVTVVPLTVIFGDEEQFENETITSDDFYTRMRTETILPTTAQAPLFRLDEEYRRLAAEGYDVVLSIHLSAALSGMVDSLRGFVADYEPIKVIVVDSQSISAGLGYQVKLARRLLEAGLTPSEIIPVLERFNRDVYVWFVVDDLKHLLRTGRISGSTAFLGNLLAIKPILSLSEGKIEPVGKERTARRAIGKIGNNVIAAAEKIEGPVRFGVIDANAPEAVRALQTQIQKAMPESPMDRGTIGPAVGVHTGEGVVGAFVAPDWQTYTL